LNGLRLVTRLDDVVALPFERMAKHRPERIFVFNEKYGERSRHEGLARV
jgi:hypothetical protein